jgi:hypothetical protein
VSARAWLAGAALAICAVTRGGEVACPGAYPGHLQGIARDDDGNLYWSFTTYLVKTDASGVERAKVAVPTHYGDLTWHAGNVYVAVNFRITAKCWSRKTSAPRRTKATRRPWLRFTSR